MAPENTDRRDEIFDLLERHEALRASSLNLVAAENSMSPVVRSVLASDLAQRYGDYTGRDLRDRRYLGTHYIAELEVVVEDLACEVFGAKYVELRPVSGHIAGNCVMMALCKPDDLVLELGRPEGGHRIATKFAAAPLIDLEVEYLPFDDQAFNIDVERTLELVRRRAPRLIIVGASNFLFPIPLKALAAGLQEYPETILVYDASHVLGLIAGCAFQQPLDEGALLIVAGTQKSFPGPQGGLIYTNSEFLIETISAAVHPAMISNHHLARLPSLGIALLEMKLWGADYANQVIRNSQALAKALVEQDVPLIGAGNHYTESHTVLIITNVPGPSDQLGRRLEKAGIIASTIRLPESYGGAGLRLGTNEVTRRGATETHMREVARLVADVLIARRSVEEVNKEVRALAEALCGYAYTWPKGPLVSPKNVRSCN